MEPKRLVSDYDRECARRWREVYAKKGEAGK